MEDVILWHNPRCSKSRQALKLLEEHGVTPKIVKYLETPPSVSEIEALLSTLAIDARALMRTKESIYKEEQLAKVENPQELIAAMAAHPKLIERPIIIHGQKAVIGRPPERLLALFETSE